MSLFPEQELTEEQFFEQFAALEDGLALLQIHMRGMSENAKLFGSLARHIRRSICPATLITEIRHVTCADMRTRENRFHPASGAGQAFFRIML